MNINEIITEGEKIRFPTMEMLLNHPTWVWMIISGAVVIWTIGILVAYTTKYDEVAYVLAVIGNLLLAIGMVLYIITIPFDSQGKEVAKWEKDLAIPFIESLPSEKKEVIYIKIDTEVSEQDSSLIHYTTSDEEKKTPVTVSYKDNGKITTITTQIETDMVLSNEEKPYVEFKQLEKDLGHGFDKGIYNMKLHLPEGYNFTEIK